MTGPLVLIEPYANRLGGHHQRTLVALAPAQPGSLVIAPQGIATESARALREASARLVTGPAGRTAGVVSAAARLTAGLSAAGQCAVFGRAAGRVACGGYRTRPLSSPAASPRRRPCGSARRSEPDADAVVILTASEALHGAAALLGGPPHLRFVHEAVTTEDAALRLLGRLARRGEERVVAVYPTRRRRRPVCRGLSRSAGGCRLLRGRRRPPPVRC